MLRPLSRRRSVFAARGKIRDARDRVRLRQQRRMALVGHLDRLQRGAARPHGLDGGGRQDVGIGAADHHHRPILKRVELLPERRKGLFEVDAFQRRGELDVIGRQQGTLW